jgi:hypothetical protein
MNKAPSYHYFTVRKQQSECCLEFDSLTEFSRFVELHNLKTVFRLVNDAGQHSHFAVTHKGGLLQQPNLGFEKLEDYHRAIKNGFPDAASFYEALKEGYTNYEDYLLVKEAGINDKKVFEELQLNGFITGFKEYDTQLKTLPGAPDISSPANAHQLMEHCRRNGFNTFSEFKAAYTKGFTDAPTYKMATERGFPTLADYNEALQKNILHYSDLQFTREHQLRDKADADRFMDLEILMHTECAHDQRVLLVLLSKLEQGKRISINKLSDLFETTQQTYLYPDTNELPVWYTRQFIGRESIIEFLTKHAAVKKYGTYDTDGEFFEINHMKDRKVVIDGSNVAHNSHGNGNSKPYYANILQLISFLKEKGFTDITVITDAALRHRIADGNRLNELKQAAEYMEAPKENPADVFIIQYVKMHHCLLVSNDNFREWKVQDSWVAENIDYYRLSFLIKGDTVMLPDLK